MKQTEAKSKIVLEAVIPGSVMIYRPDQSNSTYDFDLHYREGTIAAVEVTASMDKGIEETTAAIRNKSKGGPAIKTRLCKNDWYIHPEPDANINKIRNHADAYLANIEREGRRDFFALPHWPSSDGIARIYQDLGVISGRVMAWVEPGYIRIAPPGSGGAVAATDVLEAVSAETFKNDNRQKLMKSARNERHLIVYIHPRHFLPWCALVDYDPPQVLPDLPPEITHVWAFTETRGKDCYKIWLGEHHRAWHSLGEKSIT